jgi:hypothetical protein
MYGDGNYCNCFAQINCTGTAFFSPSLPFTSVSVIFSFQHFILLTCFSTQIEFHSITRNANFVKSITEQTHAYMEEANKLHRTGWAMTGEGRTRQAGTRQGRTGQDVPRHAVKLLVASLTRSTGHLGMDWRTASRISDISHCWMYPASTHRWEQALPHGRRLSSLPPRRTRPVYNLSSLWTIYSVLVDVSSVTRPFLTS